MEVVGITQVTLRGGPAEGQTYINELEPPDWFFITETWSGGDKPWFGTGGDKWEGYRVPHPMKWEVVLGENYRLWTGSPYTRYHLYRLVDAFTATYEGWTTVLRDDLDN